MKINFDFEKITSFAKANLKYLPWLIVGVTAIFFLALSYRALYPSADSAHILEGEARVKNLDVRFNTKLLGELSATKAPTQLGTAGGRDPFSSF